MSRKPGQPPRRVSLQLKVVVGLLFISMLPLAVSAVLIDQISRVAQNFASNEAAAMRPFLDDASDAYRELFDARKEVYRQTSLRVASAPELSAAIAGADAAVAGTLLDAYIAEEGDLRRVWVVDASGTELVARPAEALELDPDEQRSKTYEQTLAGTTATVHLEYVFSRSLEERFQKLGKAIKNAERIKKMRRSLPSGYRIAFLVLVGGVVVIVTATGILYARRITSRIAVLVSGTRRVAAGNLEARVQLSGRDELGELARAFNRMIEDLQHDRDQIAYLQRVGAWQDVARKLAHEIKNPLTPIQLAVQQSVSKYDGDDETYRKLLADTEEIVAEEISSLRRLVDAFRTLGQLPKVEAQPLDLGTVAEDLTRDPQLVDRLELRPPEGEVMIRGDRLLLRRVLTNLVENGVHAGKAANRGGAVVVTWQPDEVAGTVVLTVDDEGDGIFDDERDKIFEPYITTKDDGTGLGLTISKKIALDHGGRLAVAKEPAPSGGARFVLTLPLADREDSLAGA